MHDESDATPELAAESADAAGLGPDGVALYAGTDVAAAATDPEDAVDTVMHCYVGVPRQSAEPLRKIGSVLILAHDMDAVREWLVLAELTHVGSLPLRMSGDFQVAPVESSEDRDAALGVLAGAQCLPDDALQQAFRMPLRTLNQVKVFVARKGSTAVASMVTARVGRLVGIWAMGTIPEYGRTRAGNALLRGVIRYHLARGASTFLLGSRSAPLAWLRPLIRSS
jgi:hypothetical protein